MAKGKQAAALFEVIHSTRQSDRQGGRGLLRTPKWWFKRRGNGAHSAGGASAAAAALPPPRPEPVIIPPMMHSAGSGDGSSGPSAGGIRVHIDPDGQHITLRFSYTAAAIVAFTVGVIVVLSFLAGRQMRPGTGGHTLLSTVTTEQLQKQPPQPAVLDLERSQTAVEPDPEPAGDDATAANPLVANPAPQWNDPKPPTTLVVDGKKRDIGLNYVVVQSYREKELAEQACEVLRRHGVNCTVESGLKGWGDKWHQVVGTRGFNYISSPEFKDYVKKIQGASKEFAPKGGWKAFQPLAYKWDR